MSKKNAPEFPEEDKEPIEVKEVKTEQAESPTPETPEPIAGEWDKEPEPVPIPGKARKKDDKTEYLVKSMMEASEDHRRLLRRDYRTHFRNLYIGLGLLILLNVYVIYVVLAIAKMVKK